MGEGMEAEFCSCDWGGEPCEWFKLREITARKAHRCCECDGAINPGDRYERVVGKWDGSISEFKTCLICSRIRADYCAPYTALRETLWAGLGVDYLGKRTPAGE